MSQSFKFLFQTVKEELQGKTDGRTDGRTAETITIFPLFFESTGIIREFCLMSFALEGDQLRRYLGKPREDKA